MAQKVGISPRTTGNDRFDQFFDKYPRYLQVSEGYIFQMQHIVWHREEAWTSV
jgi:hypothetical protein